MPNDRCRPDAHWPTDERPLACRAAWLARELPGSVHAYARAVFYAGLAAWAWAWAWEELVSGVNWVRRAIGAAGLVYVAGRVGAALEG